MKFIFHIGMAKTGSSSIQHALWSEAAYLRQHNILYPIDPDAPARVNHRLYALGMRPMGKLPRHMQRLVPQGRAQTLLQTFHGHVRKSVEELSPELLLLSAETLFHRIDREMGPAFREMLLSLGAEPVFVAYLRRPSEWYLSVLQQHLRTSAQIGIPHPPRMRQVIRDYIDLFGHGSLRVHAFDRQTLADGDVVEDFSRRYLADQKVDPARLRVSGPRNPGVSAEAMILLQAFCQDLSRNPGNVPRHTTRRLRETLSQGDAALGLPKARLRQEVAEAIDYSAKAPLWLRDHYGIAFPEFDYPRLEAGNLSPALEAPLRLDEIVRVDPEALAALIGYVRQSDWPVWGLRHLVTLNWSCRRRKRWLDNLETRPALAGHQTA